MEGPLNREGFSSEVLGFRPGATGASTPRDVEGGSSDEDTDEPDGEGAGERDWEGNKGDERGPADKAEGS